MEDEVNENESGNSSESKRSSKSKGDSLSQNSSTSRNHTGDSERDEVGEQNAEEQSAAGIEESESVRNSPVQSVTQPSQAPAIHETTSSRSVEMTGVRRSLAVALDDDEISLDI